jgi:predicted deacylase
MLSLPHVTLGGTPGPHLLITAGVHGDEYEPMQAVRRLIKEFQALNLRGKVTLVPVVNQAAFKRLTRTAEDGQDLARVCPGRIDGTPTEQVAAALSEFIRAADFYIDLHTGGRMYNLLPLVGYVLHTDEKILQQQRAMAHAFNLPIVWGTQGRLEGRSLSVARDAGVPALYAEFGGGGGNPAAVDAYVDGCLQVAGQIGLIDRPLPHSLVTYEVEDDRDEAGHLQVQFPAPADGFFEPLVGLGQVVERGQPFGRIVNELGDELAQLVCRDAGLVLFLRVVPAVMTGDGLGGLLPITAAGKVCYKR